MPDYSRHQQKIIKGYFDHRDGIMLAKLQEIVTEIYLADSPKKIENLWNRAEKAMDNLKIPRNVKSRLLSKKDPELLARQIRDWLSEIKSES